MAIKTKEEVLYALDIPKEIRGWFLDLLKDLNEAELQKFVFDSFVLRGRKFTREEFFKIRVHL